MTKHQPWFLQEIQFLGSTPYTDANGYATILLHERWEEINKVYPLLDYCDYLARIEVSIPSNEYDILTVHQATILHLLCAAIDAWATGEWMDFGTWLIMTARPKYEHFGLIQRNTMLENCVAEVRNAERGKALEVLLSGLKGIQSIYQDNFGKWRKFRDFFATLPEAVKQILIEHYVIGENADFTEVEAAWAARAPADNLALIAKYLWNWRRSKFTHEAKADRSSVPESFKLLKNVDTDENPEWVVSSNIPEHMLVRSALVASIRQAVFGDVARIHVRTHIHTLIRRYCSPEDRARYIEKFGPYVND